MVGRLEKTGERMKEPDLKERIDRMEKLLLDLAIHKHRCKYIYIEDLREALIRRGIYNEKIVRLKAMNIEWHTPPDIIK